MHYGTNSTNQIQNYSMIGSNERKELNNVKEEKDLGVIFDESLKFSNSYSDTSQQS